MSTASMTFGQPTRLVIPRGALWFGLAAAALIAQIHAFDRWLLSRHQRDPQTPEEILHWANEIESTDPGFASDLRGAAMRAMESERA